MLILYIHCHGALYCRNNCQCPHCYCKNDHCLLTAATIVIVHFAVPTIVIVYFAAAIIVIDHFAAVTIVIVHFAAAAIVIVIVHFATE